MFSKVPCFPIIIITRILGGRIEKEKHQISVTSYKNGELLKEFLNVQQVEKLEKLLKTYTGDTNVCQRSF